jgi:hypothetical protein
MAKLVVRERGGVPDPTDEYAPKELLAKKDADHRQRVEGERAALKQLKEETKRERAALESSSKGREHGKPRQQTATDVQARTSTATSAGVAICRQKSR